MVDAVLATAGAVRTGILQLQLLSGSTSSFPSHREPRPHKNNDESHSPLLYSHSPPHHATSPCEGSGSGAYHVIVSLPPCSRPLVECHTTPRRSRPSTRQLYPVIGHLLMSAVLGYTVTGRGTLHKIVGVDLRRPKSHRTTP